jgi:hypothetical protein
LCFSQIARAMGLEVPEELDPSHGISLSYQEFLDAIGRMREVDFPIERDPADAWADFVGWRVNYEQAAYAVAAAVDAAPALWPGPRRRGRPAIPPSAHRSDGRPNKLGRRDHMRTRGGMAGRATTAGHLAADTPRKQASPRAGSGRNQASVRRHRGPQDPPAVPGRYGRVRGRELVTVVGRAARRWSCRRPR